MLGIMSLASPPPLDPLALFLTWFDEATAAGAQEPEVMALATATPEGRPSVRYVLYRGLSGDGIRFFTNLESRKGGELASNPRAAAVFFWNAPGLRHQIRLEGRIEQLPDAEDDAYFASRPRGHRLAALASPQSRPIPHTELLAALRRAREDARGPRGPPAGHWGGFRLVPDTVERWIAQDNRLHRRTRSTTTAKRAAVDGRGAGAGYPPSPAAGEGASVARHLMTVASRRRSLLKAAPSVLRAADRLIMMVGRPLIRNDPEGAPFFT